MNRLWINIKARRSRHSCTRSYTNRSTSHPFLTHPYSRTLSYLGTVFLPQSTSPFVDMFILSSPSTLPLTGSVCLSVCVSGWRTYVCMSVSVFVCALMQQHRYPGRIIPLCLGLSVCLSVLVYLSLSVCPSLCLGLSVYLSLSDRLCLFACLACL